MRAFYIIALFALIFITSTAVSWAQDKAHYPIGEVIEVEGQSYYVRPNKRKRIIKINDPIYLNSILQTGKDSKVLILFIDDTQLTLAEQTELTIDEYVFDPYDPEENEAEFSIVDGSFHWFSGMISKRERPRVRINTSIGSIDIRGTEFWAGEIDQGYGIDVTKGLVSFAGNWGNIELPAGKSAFIPRSLQKPDDSIKWSEERKHRAYMKTTFTRQKFIEDSLKDAQKANIRKRHDYRGQMFPYKENPFGPNYKFNPDDFFTEEFKELQRGAR